MIFEGSCDTKDWSNDAENQLCITVIHYILKYIKIEKKVILNCNNIFDQINVALVSIIYFFQMHFDPKPF